MVLNLFKRRSAQNSDISDAAKSDSNSSASVSSSGSKDSTLDKESTDDIDDVATLRKSKKFYHLQGETARLRYSWEHIEDIANTSSVESRGVGIFRSINDVVEVETRSLISDMDSSVSASENYEHSSGDEFAHQHMELNSERVNSLDAPELEAPPATPNYMFLDASDSDASEHEELALSFYEDDDDDLSTLFDEDPLYRLTYQELHQESELESRLSRQRLQSPRFVLHPEAPANVTMGYFTFEDLETPIFGTGPHKTPKKH